MDMLNYVVGLIQQIHDAEIAVANMRELLDTAWQHMLAEGRLLPDQMAQQQPVLLLEFKKPELLQLPPPATNAGSQTPSSLG